MSIAFENSNSAGWRVDSETDLDTALAEIVQVVNGALPYAAAEGYEAIAGPFRQDTFLVRKVRQESRRHMDRVIHKGCSGSIAEGLDTRDCRMRLLFAQAVRAKHYQAGNCSERALLALCEVWERVRSGELQGVERVEVVRLDGGDHLFALVNRPEGDSGLSGYVVDPWMRISGVVSKERMLPILKRFLPTADWSRRSLANVKVTTCFDVRPRADDKGASLDDFLVEPIPYARREEAQPRPQRECHCDLA